MSRVHGKHTVITVDENDLSQYCNTSEYSRARDSHDLTGYGADGHTHQGGLTNGTFSMGGHYDSTASTGPRAVLQPLLDDDGDPVTVVRQPEGAGSGLPQDSFDALLTRYVETSPVADYVQWSAEFQISGTVDDTAQT